MKIKREVFAVAHGVRDSEGNKGEPEQMPTRSLIESEMTVGLSTGGAAQLPVQAKIPMLVTHDAPAGEAAVALAARCALCKHFRRKAWKQLVEECDFPTAPLMKKQAINEVRTALLMTKNAQIQTEGSGDDEGMDVENVMRTQMGLCSVLSDLKRDYVVVHQIGCCPEASNDTSGKVVAIKTKERPTGFFVPRDREARKEAAATYDAVLKQAQGKIT